MGNSSLVCVLFWFALLLLVKADESTDVPESSIITFTPVSMEDSFNIHDKRIYNFLLILEILAIVSFAVSVLVLLFWVFTRVRSKPSTSGMDSDEEEYYERTRKEEDEWSGPEQLLIH